MEGNEYQQLLLGLQMARDLCDFHNAILWGPQGFLWGDPNTKRPLPNILGAISSFLALRKILAQQRHSRRAAAAAAAAAATASKQQ